jgi:transposase
LAYYTLLSLAPLLVLIVSITGLFFKRGIIQSGLVAQVQALMGPVGAGIVQAILENAKLSSGVIAGAVGALMLLVALEFLGGVPEAVIPDNVKTGVKHPCRYEPDLNPTYREMAEHDGLAVLPARPYKPRDNEAIAPLLDRLNRRPFRKRRDACRASLFQQLDQPARRPLPVERYVLAQWKKVRPNIDYHVEIERHYYSVPYQLVGQELEARYPATTVEIFYHGVRVASHRRGLVAHAATTLHAHRPKSHGAHLEWTPSRLIHWGARVGPATAELVRIILESKPHPEMGYRACLGIMGVAKTYPAARLEAASQRALRLRAHSYPSLKSILKVSVS